MIRYEDLIRWLEQANKKIQENKETLTELDQAVGDGDHGINLARGFNEVAAKISDRPATDIGALCQEVGMVLLSKVGGASGPLYATAFIKMAGVLKGKREISVGELSQAFREAVNGLKMRGKAETGNKTMVDVWEPVSAYVEEKKEDLSWERLKQFAREQMEKTKELEAKKGRAAYLGPRSAGHLDPGAVSSYYLFETLCDVLARGE